MNNNSKYIDYQVNDFVEDDDFRKWVVSPNLSQIRFWDNFLKENPSKKEICEQARQIVQTICVEEKEIKPDEYQESLDFLKNYLVQKSQKMNYAKTIFTWWSKVAAVLLIPLVGLGLVYFYVHSQTTPEPQVVQYMVANGEKSKVILADGTNVWLNSGSKLDYIIDNTSKVRKVHLSGEAFFDVTKNNAKPFLVETKDYTVKVYGTKFNVNSYELDKTSETILEEGAVSILFKNKEEIKIHPGQRFLLNENKRYRISQVDTELYSCWKNSVLRIDNERLEDLLVRLERWYGVKMTVNDFEQVKNLKYTLTIKTESLREMLELMKYVTPFDYQIDGENVFLTYH